MRCALKIGLYRDCLVARVVGIGRRLVVPDALCRWDWRGGRRVGDAVPLGVHSVAELE